MSEAYFRMRLAEAHTNLERARSDMDKLIYTIELENVKQLFEEWKTQQQFKCSSCAPSGPERL